IGFDDVVFEMAYEDILPVIQEEQRVSLTGTDTVPCDEGVATISTTFSATFNSDYSYNPNRDTDTVTTLSFASCLLEGDILGNGDDNRLRLNGTVTHRTHNFFIPDIIVFGGVGSEDDPAKITITGSVSVTADENADGDGNPATDPLPFWASPVHFNSTAYPDNYLYNGGICAGSTVRLGGATPPDDAETSDDDDCAFDGDLGAEAFIQTDWIYGEGDDLTALVETSFTAAGLADSLNGVCFELGCDGDLSDALPVSAAKGAGEGDLVALDYLMVFPFYDVPDVEDILMELDDAGLLPTISSTAVLSLTGVATAECDEGQVSFSLIFTGTFDSEYILDTGEDYDAVYTVSFDDCLVEGDVLDLGDDNRLRIDGTLSAYEHSPAFPSAGDAYAIQLLVSLALEADENTDDDNNPATNPSPFWATPLNANSGYVDDGDTSWTNGGACAGAGVDLGADPEDDADDDCFADPDAEEEAFIPGYYLMGTVLD
ncbi:MAG: hypothetical protein AB1405_12745, partial [Bdellovibrionota bacterium]